MYRSLSIVAFVFGIALASASCVSPDDRTAQEWRILNGLWATDPPKESGRRNELYFKDGKMLWESIRYEGGEPLIGHRKGYLVTLDTFRAPKHMTLKYPDPDDRDTRLAVYAVVGDTLRMAIGGDEQRPASLDAKDALLLTLKKIEVSE